MDGFCLFIREMPLCCLEGCAVLLSSFLCCLDEHPSCGGEEGEGLGEDELLLEREGEKNKGG